MGAHTPVLPVYSHDPSFQVSLPNSPARGIVWKVHRRLPVRTSKPRISAGTFVFDVGDVPFLSAAPTMRTSLTMIGGDVAPISPGFTRSRPSYRSTMPL